MTPPTSTDGTDISAASIDGQEVQEITVDGQTVFTALPDIPASITSFWPFDEGSGTTLNDAVGSVPASLQKSGLWVAASGSQGGFHTELTDAEGSYWQTDTSVGFTGRLTVLQWVNLNSSPLYSPDIFLYYGSPGNRNNSFTLEFTPSDTLSLVRRENGSFFDPDIKVSPLDVNEWYLIAATLEDSTNDVNLYVFNETGLEGSDSGTFDPNYLPADSIMKGNNGNFYDEGQAGMKIDAPALSINTVLSQSEVSQYAQETR